MHHETKRLIFEIIEIKRPERWTVLPKWNCQKALKTNQHQYATEKFHLLSSLVINTSNYQTESPINQVSKALLACWQGLTMQWLDSGPIKEVTKSKKIASKTIALLKQLIEESLTINQSNYQPTLCKVDFLSVFLFVPSERIWMACCSTLIRSHLSRFAEGQRHPKWTVMRHPVNQGDF